MYEGGQGGEMMRENYDDMEQVICPKCKGVNFTATEGQNDGLEDTLFLFCDSCGEIIKYAME